MVELDMSDPTGPDTLSDRTGQGFVFFRVIEHAIPAIVIAGREPFFLVFKPGKFGQSPVWDYDG